MKINSIAANVDKGFIGFRKIQGTPAQYPGEISVIGQANFPAAKQGNQHNCGGKEGKGNILKFLFRNPAQKRLPPLWVSSHVTSPSFDHNFRGNEKSIAAKLRCGKANSHYFKNR